MIDIKILKFLYLKKHDGNFHDVSLLFNVSNHNNFYNEIENPPIQGSEEPSSSKSKYKNKLCKTTFDKEVIDNSVIALEENGYVVKKVKGYLPPSALNSEDESSNANNSECKISSKGIEYYETKMQYHNTKVHSTIALIFSFIALIISILAIL